MNQNYGHHEIRAPSMQRADKPAESHIMVQSLKTVPRFSRRRHVSQSEENPGSQLHKEDDECGAAKYVPPACRVSWDGMFGGFPNGSRQLQAAVEPFPNLCDHAHGGVLLSRAALAPGVGSSPA